MTCNQQTHGKAFTPGPYGFYRGADGCDEFIYIVDAVDNKELATISLSWDLTPEKLAQATANAVRFASAPDLVKAIKGLLALAKPAGNAADEATVKFACSLLTCVCNAAAILPSRCIRDAHQWRDGLVETEED